MLKLLEEVRARVNAGFEMLARDIEAGRRVPAHERPPGLAAAHSGLQALSQRFRFGAADAATAATTANWPRSARRCSSSSWPKS